MEGDFAGLTLFRADFGGVESSESEQIGRLDGIDVDGVGLGNGGGEDGDEDNKLDKTSHCHSSGILVLR
jgi:hypothetical protein